MPLDGIAHTKVRRQSRVVVANALKTTRSTVALRGIDFSENDARRPTRAAGNIRAIRVIRGSSRGL